MKAKAKTANSSKEKLRNFFKERKKLVAIGGITSILLVLFLIIFSNPAVLRTLIGGALDNNLVFTAENGLTTQTGRVEGTSIILPPGAKQSGPNEDLGSGLYTIVWHGNNFNDRYENITLVVDGISISPEETVMSNNRIEVEVDLELTRPVNFELINNTDRTLTINRVEVTRAFQGIAPMGIMPMSGAAPGSSFGQMGNGCGWFRDNRHTGVNLPGVQHDIRRGSTNMPTLAGLGRTQQTPSLVGVHGQGMMYCSDLGGSVWNTNCAARWTAMSGRPSYITAAQNNNVRLAAAFGYGFRGYTGSGGLTVTGRTTNEWRIFTQNRIWQLLGADIRTSNVGGNATSGRYQTMLNQLTDSINRFNARPTFPSSTTIAFGATTTIRGTYNWNISQDYTVHNARGQTVTLSGNNLTVTGRTSGTHDIVLRHREIDNPNLRSGWDSANQFWRRSGTNANGTRWQDMFRPGRPPRPADIVVRVVVQEAPPPPMQPPSKTVWHNTNNGGSITNNNTVNTLPGRYEPFEFRVSTFLPARTASQFFFNSFEIIDEINPVLNINTGAITVRHNGNVVSCTPATATANCRFYITVTGQRVVATARASHLNTAAFYGQTYVLHIPVVVRPGANLTNCQAPHPTASYCIPNRGSIRYNGNNRNTNDTTTIINPPPRTPRPNKTVSGGTITPGSNDRENTLPGRFEPFEFRVSANLPARHSSYFFTSMVITDYIIPELDVNNPVIRTGGNIVPTCNPQVPTTVTDACVFYITVVEITEGENAGYTRVRATARANHLNQAAFYGRTYVLHIPVQVQEGADLSRFLQADGNYHLPNVGRLDYTMLGRPGGENTPPTNTIIKPPPPSPEPVKTVTGGTNKTPQHNVLENRYEPFEFQITTEVSQRHSSYFFRAFEIIDDIVPELDVTNVRMTADDQDIVTCTPAEETPDCVFVITLVETTIAGRTGYTTVTARARAEHLSRASFYGLTYTLHIEVVVRDGADLSRFLNPETNTFIIPNEGRIRYTILGREIEEIPTPPTETEIIPPDLRIEKTSDRHEVTINEPVNYRVEVTQVREGATARNVVITDTLPDAVRLIPNTVRVQMRTMEYANIAPEVPGEGEENGGTTQTPPQAGTPRPVYRDIEGVVITTNNNTIVVTVPRIAYRETVVITYRATPLQTGRHINVVIAENPDTPDIEDDNTIRVDRIVNPQTGVAAGIALIISAIGLSLGATILVTIYIRKKGIISD